MTRMQKKVLPGKDWLLHTLPGLYPADCDSLLDKKNLTAASYKGLKCSPCMGQRGLERERRAACVATDRTRHTKHTSQAQPPGLGTAETEGLRARAPFLLHLIYIWRGEGVRSHDSVRKSLYLFCLEGRWVQRKPPSPRAQRRHRSGCSQMSLDGCPPSQARGWLPPDRSQQKETFLHTHPPQKPSILTLPVRSRGREGISWGRRCGHSLPSSDSAELRGPAGPGGHFYHHSAETS